MSIQVIGAGLGRTGTLSLKTALEELGFAKCYHPVEVFATWTSADLGRRRARRAGRLGPALRRLPGDRRFARLRVLSRAAEKYPEAKVILTVRDPERWYDSVRQTIYFARNTFPKWTVLLLGPRRRIFQRVLDRLWIGCSGAGSRTGPSPSMPSTGTTSRCA